MNQDLKLHVMKLYEIEAEHREAFYKASESYQEAIAEIDERFENRQIDRISAAKRRSEARERHFENVRAVCTRYRIKCESMHQETMEGLCKLCDVDSVRDIMVGDHRIFENLSSHEKSRVSDIIVADDGTLKSDKELVKIAFDFAEHRQCKTFNEFAAYTEFLAIVIAERKTETLIDLRKNMKEKKEKGCKQKDLLKALNVPDNLPNEATRRSRADFLGERRLEAFREVGRQFDELKEKVGPINTLAQRSASGSFPNDNSATYHIRKHDLPKGSVEQPELFFQLAERICRHDPKTRMLSQDGSSYTMTFEDLEKKIRVIKLETVAGNGDTSYLLTMYAYEKKKKKYSELHLL